jgi:Putative silver efflux pump
MLATGIKSPVGIKVNGNNLADIERVAQEIEGVVKTVPGVTSALAERLSGGRYVDIAINRQQAARYGVSVQELQSLVSTLVGGENVGQPWKDVSVSRLTSAILAICATTLKSCASCLS